MESKELIQAIRVIIQKELKPIKEVIAELNTTVNNLEGQQIENSRFIHALRHNSEEANAQLHPHQP